MCEALRDTEQSQHQHDGPMRDQETHLLGTWSGVEAVRGLLPVPLSAEGEEP